MFTSTKTILNIFTRTALLRASDIIKNRDNISDLVDTASQEINSGKKKILSVQSEFKLILQMLRAWAIGEYRDVPWMTLLLSAGALIYFVNPFDAVPDLIPGAGLVDDATVIGFVLASIRQDVQNFKARYDIGCQ